MFELWVEHQKVIGNLSLPDAISAFFHLCFVAHLEYPKVRYQFFCHTNNMSQGAGNLVDLMQHSMAKYGDNTGTRSLVKAVSAEKKRETYYAILGRLLGK